MNELLITAENILHEYYKKTFINKLFKKINVFKESYELIINYKVIDYNENEVVNSIKFSFHDLEENLIEEKIKCSLLKLINIYSDKELRIDHE